MRVKRKYVLVCILLALVLSVSVYTNITNTAKNILVLDSLLNGTKMEYTLPEVEEDITSGESIYGAYNTHHQKALLLDMTKIDEMLKERPVRVPEQFYDLSIYSSGKYNVDYIYQIESYKLICEILTQPEINPDDSVFRIEPYHVYGSWFNETRLFNQSQTSFDIYNNLITITNDYGYKGPFQLSSVYHEQDSSKIDIYTPRMYTFVSTGENNSVGKDTSTVLRIQTKELFTNLGIRGKIIGNTYDEVDGKYILDVKKSIKYQQDRPNPQYLPDAIYTFCRKLRTTSYGKDIYTLNENKSYKNSLDCISHQDDKYQSDLTYLYAVQLNSSFIKGHQWTEDGTVKSDGTGLMPRLYAKMIDKYGTLDVYNLYGFSGWKQQPDLETFITGKEKGKGHLSSQPIVNTTNLVDDLGLRSEFDSYIKTLSTELAQTMSYGLECISNGKMIQFGIEAAIDDIYSWQESKGYLLNGTSSNEDVQEELAQGILQHFNGVDVLMSLPWSYSEPLYTLVYHDFFCNGNPLCSAHPRYTHYGVDYNQFNKERTKRIASNITVWTDGVIDEVRLASDKNNPWGNSVKILHKIGNKEYYSRYAHMDSMSFTKEDIGTKVTTGQFIGVEGSTGRSTGLHLHFGISIKNKNGSETPVNPEIVLSLLRQKQEN